MGASGACLEVVTGKAIGMSILVDDELVIGRHAEGAGRLADDEEISRTHARVALDGSGFCSVEDLGSTNGTFVNGLRITVPQTLTVGDTIELGGTTLVVRELPSQPSDPLIPSERTPPTLTLQLQVDFDAREAQLKLGDISEPVRLVFDGDAWRSVFSPPIEKGSPA